MSQAYFLENVRFSNVNDSQYYMYGIFIDNYKRSHEIVFHGFIILVEEHKEYGTKSHIV